MILELEIVAFIRFSFNHCPMTFPNMESPSFFGNFVLEMVAASTQSIRKTASPILQTSLTIKSESTGNFVILECNINFFSLVFKINCAGNMVNSYN